MRLYPYTTMLASAAAFATCVVSAAAFFLRTRSKEINEVMVFCKLQYNAFNCFDKFISYIEGAKSNIHVCMPGIHNQAIQGRLLEVMKAKKIAVRVILDRTGYDATDPIIKELLDAGAEIRCKANERVYKMQHKFCIIDDNILMTGTLNWGNDRSSDHWNYVYITSKRQLVEPVKQSFYQMWNSFSSEVPIEQTQSNTNEIENIETHCNTNDSGTVDIQDELNDHEDKNELVSQDTQMTPELCLG
ncbi:mitochondrial cardiolipin hydrolase [Amyelois transitella]|uniref:mitochondrial cardiolipin hydrolase n=1 Tax=Amyelois transitella TaxID=680683 RepID=UPI00298FBF6F|nr:mitochondrial cardiolipin hydrolase [Amyelois transitella]